MPKPPELANYADEDAFTKTFLIPLLQRLGFSVVMYHGTREFGKDLIFAEIDRFGHVVYNGLQTKYVDSIGLGKASQDLIFDAQQAFANPFTHPQTGTQQRISGFYAVNGGGISDQAREHIFNSLHPQFGANIRLIDGTGLLSLDRMAALTRSGFVKERLSGLILELKMNRTVLSTLSIKLPLFIEKGPYPIVRLRLAACLAVLEQPIVMDESFLNGIQWYWQTGRIFNDVIDSADLPFISDEFVNTRAKDALDLIASIDRMGVSIESAASQYLAQLATTITGL